MSEPCQSKEFTLAMNYTQAVANAATDVVCSFFPIHLISKSKMRRREKIAVIILLLLAILFVHFDSSFRRSATNIL
jgi:hypothetical protein